MSFSSNSWIVVAICHATHYVETAALRMATADCTGAFLCRGTPWVLISDRDRSFLAGTVLLHAHNVVHSPTMATLHRQMAFTCWQICLSCIFRIITPIGTSPYLLFVSHTTALQATTGFLSSLLVYSREATCILDTLLPCSYGLYSDGGIQPRSSGITIGAWARAPDGTRK